MINILEERSLNSAAWAAYGDALGFITELASPQLVKSRTGLSKITNLRKWKRKVGGRFGIMVELPEGCYSDDTQLRLSTSRSIHDDGYFDVESFAKIELPIWLSYALGAGVGTKFAASNLMRRDVNWFSNFFENKKSSYFNGGGNGAAMRIQPHVWSRVNCPNSEGLILDVLRNSITTHGHPRGFVGAVFYALCLDISLRHQTATGPDDWRSILDQLLKIPSYLRKDRELRSFWLPTWESKTRKSIDHAVEEVVLELAEAIDVVCECTSKSNLGIEELYFELTKKLGGLDPATRGSGIVCSILACTLAWLPTRYPSNQYTPKDLIVLSINLLQSDTDTIATMAGAILGAVNSDTPPQKLLDQEYIEEETRRLVNRESNHISKEFNYPDVSGWKAPRNQSDALGVLDNRLFVAGLGAASALSEAFSKDGQQSLCLRWIKLEFGQTLLIKCRLKIESNMLDGEMYNDIAKETVKDTDASSGKSASQNYSPPNWIGLDLDELTTEAIKSGFDERIIGSHIMFLSDSGGSIDMVVAYTAIIAKARISRNKHIKR